MKEELFRALRELVLFAPLFVSLGQKSPKRPHLIAQRIERVRLAAAFVVRGLKPLGHPSHHKGAKFGGPFLRPLLLPPGALFLLLQRVPMPPPASHGAGPPPRRGQKWLQEHFGKSWRASLRHISFLPSSLSSFAEVGSLKLDPFVVAGLYQHSACNHGGYCAVWRWQRAFLGSSSHRNKFFLFPYLILITP